MKTIFVTGCAGFIGSHLCECLLKDGYSVIGIDNFDEFYDKKIKMKNIAGSLKHPNYIFKEIDILNTLMLNSITDKIDMVIYK